MFSILYYIYLFFVLAFSLKRKKNNNNNSLSIALFDCVRYLINFVGFSFVLYIDALHLLFFLFCLLLENKYVKSYVHVEN